MPTRISENCTLRSILRQDPDKVMVGEIRDQKTAQIVIRAAFTGHFVLLILHTNDAPSAAICMIDMGVPPFLVSASLSGVIAQRLVRRLCPICREEYELNPNMCETLNVPLGTHAFRPRGCNECRNGYKGRRGIYPQAAGLTRVSPRGGDRPVIHSSSANFVSVSPWLCS